MQANQIKFGQHYVANVNGKQVIFQPTDMITNRNSAGTVNRVKGYVGLAEDPETGTRPTAEIEVSAVLDTIDKHKALMEEKAKLEADRKAQQAEAVATMNRAANLLAEALGTTIFDYGSDKDGFVKKSYSGVEVMREGLPALIAFLEKK